MYDELGQSKVPSEMCCLAALFKTCVRMVDERDSGCCFEHYNVVFVRYLRLRGLYNQYGKLHITFNFNEETHRREIFNREKPKLLQLEDSH